MITPDKNKTENNNNSIVGNLVGYIDTRLDLMKLEIQNKLKSGFVGVLHISLLAITALMALLFLNIFLGLLLNDLLDSRFWGFGIVTLFYIIVFVALIIGLDKKVFQGLADKIFDNTIYKTDKTDKNV